VHIDSAIDASELNCPLPLLKAKKALAGLSSGQVLSIISTDPGSVQDFEAFAKQFGHTLLEAWEEDGKFFFLMKKA
jgi:tRNA 2-thiouridine synthesizing protein A